MRYLAHTILLAACGPTPRDAVIDAPASMDATAEASIPIAPVAPSVGDAMYQGGQTEFRTQFGTSCHGRVAASMGETGFCYLAANDEVTCAGVIGGVDYGRSFQSTGQTGATQIMVMWYTTSGMCVAKTDHTVWCMGTNTNAFGAGNTSTTFSKWTDRRDIAAIATGTWDQICGLTTAGQVLCGGIDIGYPPIDVGAPGQTSVWIDVSGIVHPSDPTVLRPSESRTDCNVTAAGLDCRVGEGGSPYYGYYGPSDGTLVMGSNFGSPYPTSLCWLTSEASVNCTSGPRFAAGKVLYLAADWYSDSTCAIYNDGSVWCMGPNTSGKLGTGDTTTLATETMVAPPGSARVSCDPE